MSRDETPDTTGLREAVEALADDYADRAARVPGDIHAPYRHAAADLREILVAHPTPDASPDPAVVTPNLTEVTEHESELIVQAAIAANRSGLGVLLGTVERILANHVAAAREADRAEVKRLRRWKDEALPVIDGLQELGKALDLPLGARITGPDAIVAVQRLRERLAGLVAKIEAEAARMSRAGGGIYTPDFIAGVLCAARIAEAKS